MLFGVAPVVLSDFRLVLLGKFLCFAIVAVGIGLAWGRGGMLVLGQGVFFGLGGYMMGMHLKIADAQIRGDDVPDFMQIAGVRELPAYWEPFASPAFTLLAIVLLPTAIAAALGLGVFKRRVKGAYFAILSQALAAALAILLVGQTSIGGSNGLNRFRTFFGFTLNDPANRRMLYFIAAGVLLLVVAVVRQLMQSRYGELLVAVRDGEERVRFLGYDPANIKVVAYTVAALFASIAGALFAPIVGFIAPSQVGILPVDRVPDRRGDRRAHDAARAGTGRDRRGMGANPVLRTLSVGVDLRAGPAVHRRRRLLPRRAWPGWASLLRRRRKAQTRRPNRSRQPERSRPGRRKGGSHVMTESETTAPRWSRSPAATSAWAPSTSKSAA